MSRAAVFPTLAQLAEDEVDPCEIRITICAHLRKLKMESERYFPVVHLFHSSRLLETHFCAKSRLWKRTKFQKSSCCYGRDGGAKMLNESHRVLAQGEGQIFANFQGSFAIPSYVPNDLPM